MPSNLLQADVGFPQFKEDQKPDEKITQVVDYLYMLLEQLRYSFGNLDADNFSESGITELEHLITEPVYAYITNVEEGLSTALNVTAQGLSTRITNEIAGVNQTITATAEALTAQIGTVDGKYTALSASVDGLNVQINDPTDGAFAKITANANAIATKVSAGDVSSAITQFANGLSLSVTNGASSSTIKLMSGTTQLSSQSIQITGMVTFSDLSTSGNTTINGENITTGTIATERIKLSGLMSVYQSNTGTGSTTVGGFLGYASGSYGTGGIGMSSADGASYVAAINASTTAGAAGGGAKMHGGPTSDYTKYSQVVANGGGVCLRYHYSNSSGDDSALYMNVISGTGFSFHPGTNKGVHLGGPSHQFATLYCDTVRVSGNMYINGSRVLTVDDL